MTRKTYYKYKTLAKKVYDLELILTLGGTGMGGCTIPAPTEYVKRKHRKVRARYDRLVKDNPQFKKTVWDEIEAAFNR